MAFRTAFRLLAVASIGAALAACASDSGPKEVTGTLVGAATGAAIGSAASGAIGCPARSRVPRSAA